MLQGSVFLLPFGVEEVLTEALEEGLGLWQVQNLKRVKLGYLVGGGITLLACVHPQGSLREATEDQGHLKVLAKDLFILHQVFRLGIRTTVDIMKNFPKKEK